MKVLPLILTTTLLTACGGGSGGTTTPTTQPKIPETQAPQEPESEALKITAFAVTPDKISPYISGGNFAISFSTTGTAQAFITASLSINETLSASDTTIYRQLCGSTLDCQPESHSTDCYFKTDNTVECSGGITTDISSIIDEIPKELFIILEACETPITNCDTASLPITLE